APVRRSKVAAFDASQPASVLRACQNSCSFPLTGSTMSRCRSPEPWRWMSSRVWPGRATAWASSFLASGQFSMGAFPGTGGVPGHRKRPGIGIGGIHEDLDGDARLVRGHDDEVHVEVVVEMLIGADRSDNARRVGLNRQFVD